MRHAQHSKPGYSGFQPGYFGPAQPEGSGLESGYSGIHSILILKLIDDAHDDMIMLKLVLEMLHLISRRFPITTNKVFSIWIVTFIFY